MVWGGITVFQIKLFGYQEIRYPEYVNDVFLEWMYNGHTLEIKEQMARGNLIPWQLPGAMISTLYFSAPDINLSFALIFKVSVTHSWSQLIKSLYYYWRLDLKALT